MGRKVKNFDKDTWKTNRYRIVFEGNFYKFSQDENLKEYLVSTKDKILVEASPYDKIWGIGMSQDNEAIKNPTNRKGQNLLGFALMEVRDDI